MVRGEVEKEGRGLPVDQRQVAGRGGVRLDVGEPDARRVAEGGGGEEEEGVDAVPGGGLP
ncbi:hypothetical protein [Streptomyces sp. SM12]|uniref:hypothetical protein n=1 Tax=Streptomyces sp. SM12 TaxID=1071602 RepID=UPI002156253F|nr:hypothetical protein [Streptomyces sp. SM12]